MYSTGLCCSLLCMCCFLPSLKHFHAPHLCLFMCLYSFVSIPCSCFTLLISLCHLSCVFSYVFHLYMSTPICPEAVSSMVWRRNETGGLSGLGQTTNLGLIIIVLSILILFNNHFMQAINSQFHIRSIIKGTIIETKCEIHLNFLLFLAVGFVL